MISQPEGFLVDHHDAIGTAAGGRVSRRVDEGPRDPRRRAAGAMLPVLYEFPPDVDWRNSVRNWWMVTPNRGLSITVDAPRCRITKPRMDSREGGI